IDVRMVRCNGVTWDTRGTLPLSASRRVSARVSARVAVEVGERGIWMHAASLEVVAALLVEDLDGVGYPDTLKTFVEACSRSASLPDHRIAVPDTMSADTRQLILDALQRVRARLVDRGALSPNELNALRGIGGLRLGSIWTGEEPVPVTDYI